jgi:competence protein ComEA
MARFLTAACSASAIVLVGLGYGLVASAGAPRSSVDGGDPDPADRQALVAVCGRCHQVSLFDKSLRSEPDWIATVQKMVDRGATGSDEQFARVGNYLLRTLTIVNVNVASAEEIAVTLNLSQRTAQAIVARRDQHGKFKSLDELKDIPGVNPAALESRKARVAFQ